MLINFNEILTNDVVSFEHPGPGLQLAEKRQRYCFSTIVVVAINFVKILHLALLYDNVQTGKTPIPQNSCFIMALYFLTNRKRMTIG